MSYGRVLSLGLGDIACESRRDLAPANLKLAPANLKLAPAIRKLAPANRKLAPPNLKLAQLMGWIYGFKRRRSLICLAVGFCHWDLVILLVNTHPTRPHPTHPPPSAVLFILEQAAGGGAANSAHIDKMTELGTENTPYTSPFVVEVLLCYRDLVIATMCLLHVMYF